MKQLFSAAAAVISALLVLNSCSVEKRRSVPGYHIEWKHKYKPSAAESQSTNYTAAEDKADSDVAAPKHQDIRNKEEITVVSSPATPSPVLAEQEKTDNPEIVNIQEADQALQQSTASPVSRFTQKLSKQSSLSQRSASSEMDKATAIILAILVLLIGLFPLSVYLVAGPGRAVRFNLLLTLAFFLFVIIGAIISIASGAGMIFIILGVICALIAFIHAIVMIIKKLVEG